MKVLILGYSNIFRKRILNVLLKKKINFCVASKSVSIKNKNSFVKFKNYKDALNNSKANIVYISLANSLHYIWAKRALEKNYHVIVDKPITLKLKEVQKLLKIAKKRNKLLAEATFFNFHKQLTKSLKILKSEKKIKLINTNFIIPQPKLNSFRMSKKFGGGCLADMGPYAAATARILGSGKLINMTSNTYKNKKGLITSFNVSCKFKKNYYFGYFSFGGEYKNNMMLISEKQNIELNNVFSPPPNKKLDIIIKKNNSLKIRKVEKDDIFRNFFQEVLMSLKKNRYQIFYKRILLDAKFRDKIR